MTAVTFGSFATERVHVAQSSGIALRRKVVCPHCWHQFPPEEILWVSVHPNLRGDAKLGTDAQRRFLPTRYSVEGYAFDPEGELCRKLACPHCHLQIPRALLELEPLFISILGTPSSGKSYYLTAMINRLRQVLSASFRIHFADADPDANHIVNKYEETLFHTEDRGQLVSLPKTEKEGDLYEPVQFEERVVHYPRPFVFTLIPQDNRPGRALCLYDNAGEHFLPGGETDDSPGTQHLAHSRALLYLFDPLQHTTFRDLSRSHSEDPQLDPAFYDRKNHEADTGVRPRQDLVLLDAARRIREQTRLREGQKTKRPLIVVVTKVDAWLKVLGLKSLPKYVGHQKTANDPNQPALQVAGLNAVSQRLQDLLRRHANEIVSAAEGFSEHVLYLPASATGCAPEIDPTTEVLGFRPKKIKPIWTEVPMLYALERSAGDLIARQRDNGTKGDR